MRTTLRNPLKSVAFKISVMTSVFVLAVIGLMARRIFTAAEEGVLGEMTVRAEFFARSSREALFPKRDPFSLHFNVEEMVKEKGITYAAVLDPAGKVLSHSQPQHIGETLKDPFTLRALAAGGPILQRLPNGAYDLAAPIAVGPRRVGTARLGFDRSSLQEALRRPRRQIAAIATIAVAAAIFGTVLIVGWITRPLPKLASAAREIGRGNFGVRVESRSNDEIGVLARAFNDMAAANALLFSTIREEKAKLEAIFNGTREGLVLTSPQGGVLLVNAAARSLLDWRGEVLDSLAEALTAGKFSGQPELSEILAGRARLISFELRRDEPKLLILAGVVDCLGEPQDPSGYLFIFRDATLEKRGESLARNFLSLVSHKLRTPLAVALGYLEILEGDAAMSPFHKKAVATIRQEEEKLRSLVEKLITFSAVQSPSSIVLEKAPTSLADVVEAALAHLAGRLGGAEIVWDAAAAASLPKASADPLMLRDAAGNLIENAIKFNLGRKKRVAIAAAKTAGGVRLSVTDNGPGIPSEEQPKLFDKFYQIDDDFTGQIPGFGLGLAFVKIVVEAHGGTVGVSSAPGKGSTFWFELPVV